jgi:hypothetical protein
MITPLPTRILLTTFTCLLLSSAVLAQDDDMDPDEKPPGRNIFRTNLTSMAFRNYEFQYERMVARRTSLGISYRTMPSGPVLFKDMIINSIEDAGTPGSVDTRREVESIRMQNYAITPEVRFYAGKKGYGHGFYLSLFFRHASHTIDNISIDYNDNAGVSRTVILTGSLTSNTGGFMLGSQWMIARRVALDWWIIGPHFGTGKGTLSGRNSSPISTADQNSLRTEIADVVNGIPFIKNTIYVDANSASVSLTGPWSGVRAGLSLGFRL